MRLSLALPLALALATACTAAAEHADPSDAAPAAHPPLATAATVTRDTTPPRDSGRTATPGAPAARGRVAGASAGRLDTVPTTVRALYVNRFAAQSRKKMMRMIAIADSTEINALVIDMKDEFGLNYRSGHPEFAKLAGTAGAVPELGAMLDTLHAHGIAAIARLVVFKDSVTARLHPDWTIRRPDGSIWRDKQGLAWVNPYHRQLWDYNIGVAEELVKLGFDEIQFDYIRFPEPYKSLPPQVFPGAKAGKPATLAAFLKTAKERLNKLGVRSTADIFGLVTTVGGALEVGQQWEQISPNVDVVLPMVYPSHYPRGAFGLAKPNAEPYKVILTAIKRARERDEKLGITTPEHVRPWLQAFSLGKPEYGPEQITAQKQAAYDAGYDGWVLWSPGSHYDAFVPALEKQMVARRKELAKRDSVP